MILTLQKVIEQPEGAPYRLEVDDARYLSVYRLGNEMIIPAALIPHMTDLLERYRRACAAADEPLEPSGSGSGASSSPT
ncbi:MAG: hypothetical protein VYB54_04805 [Pseudomonadota bacterium]|nr:hypothetical protein [Pseudomonadota bacterium]